MGVKIIPVNGTAADGIELISSHALIFDDGAPPLADDNLLTWIQNEGGQVDYNVRIAALTDYTAGDPISLHVRLSLSTDGEVGSDSRIYLFLQDGHGTEATGNYYVGQFTNGSYNTRGTIPTPFDGTPHDLVFPLVPRPAGTGAGYGVAGKTLADCLAVLASGDAWLNVNTLEAFDGSGVEGRIYEAWLEVGVPATVVPPCQLYPRDDDQGVGSAAIWPPPSSSRPGSYY